MTRKRKPTPAAAHAVEPMLVGTISANPQPGATTGPLGPRHGAAVTVTLPPPSQPLANLHVHQTTDGYAVHVVLPDGRSSILRGSTRAATLGAARRMVDREAPGCAVATH